MTTDKLIAELKLVSWVDRKPGMGSMDAVYLDDAIQIIRNHQPEPTKKQVDEKLQSIAHDLKKCAATWASDARLLGNVRAADIYALCDDYLNRPYLRQVDNVGGEPQQVSGDDLTHDLYHSLSWLYEVAKVSDTNYAAVTNAAAIMSRYETATRTPKKQPVKVDELIAKIDKASQTVRELCNGTRKWIMSIPARIDYDPDIIISDALYSAKAALQTPQSTVEPKGESVTQENENE